ncbi:MAG: glycoside hydrolase family 32 protein [Flavisolibacter sp.]
MKSLILLAMMVAWGIPKCQKTATPEAAEPFRPQIHFSPQQHWMNDPNGMVYYHNLYHLFYQYYPGSTIWGPMHWGHATSKDLIHWKHRPVALYPDSLGYIFSGSAVVDTRNTSGFGKDGAIPLVAIFTHHDPKGEKEGKTNYQNQSIAYSLDKGQTWKKYAHNPVLINPGIKDFRDPKVSWYAKEAKWIMTLATLDCISFFSSMDLKNWNKESEFGKKLGAHGGVWECPDLFPLRYGGKTIWVLLVSINPGGPNGGSATQYFTGTFDGKSFTPFQTNTRWIDYGPDDYAGVTYFNTGDRKIFLGWMSNWNYGTVVPTQNWRSAMTLPRDLGIEKIGDQYFLTSKPIPELKGLSSKTISLSELDAHDTDLTKNIGKLEGPFLLKLKADTIASFSLSFLNAQGEKIKVGYNQAQNQYYIDRTKSGIVDFNKGFAGNYTAPRISQKMGMELTLMIDKASIDFFADEGLTVMTAIFFPRQPYTQLKINANDHFKIKALQYTTLKSIYSMAH